MYVCMHIYIYTSIPYWVTRSSVQTRRRFRQRSREIVDMHFIYMCVCVCVYVCIYIYMYVHIYVYLSIYTFISGNAVQRVDKSSPQAAEP